MKTQTQIDKVIQEGLTNKETVKNLFGLSELEYNTHLFESGMSFLEMMFPAGTHFEQFQILHSRTKLFWTWFQIQYETADKAYLTMRKSLTVSVPQPRLENYNQRVIKLINEDTRFQDSFNNYLNALKRNEKIMLTGRKGNERTPKTD